MPNDLSEILSLVAKGRLSPMEAKALIESSLGSKDPADKPRPTEAVGEDPDSREGLLAAFDKLRKSVHVDELLKISSGLVQQIAENMPERIERLQESVSHNINALGFSAGSNGVEAKLSVFRTFHVGPSARVEANTVVGSQWFGVNFDDEATVRENKFTAVQFSEVAVLRSDFQRNVLGLSRLSNVTIQESRLESSRFSRSTFSDVSFAESDFDSVRLLKSEFSQTVLNASRIAGCAFEGTGIEECEFDSCEIENVTFENCTFKECVFDGVRVRPEEPLRIVGRAVTGRVFRRLRDARAFLAALEDEGASLDEEGGTVEEADSSRARGATAHGGASEGAEPLPRNGTGGAGGTGGARAFRRGHGSRQGRGRDPSAEPR